MIFIDYVPVDLGVFFVLPKYLYAVHSKSVSGGWKTLSKDPAKKSTAQIEMRFSCKSSWLEPVLTGLVHNKGYFPITA